MFITLKVVYTKRIGQKRWAGNGPLDSSKVYVAKLNQLTTKLIPTGSTNFTFFEQPINHLWISAFST